MQDRVSLYPGRVKLVPVAGQENTYDMVRADSPTQEGTTLNKDSLLKDATAALFGLGADAVPDDVLAYLGKYNQYWWKRQEVGEYVIDDSVELENARLFWSTKSNLSGPVYYYDNISLDKSNGVITPSGAQHSVNVGYSTSSNASVLRGKYFYEDGKTSGTLYYAPENAQITTQAASGYYYTYIQGRQVYAKLNQDQNIEYIYSSNRNAYPDNGESGGYEYKYLGIPFDNAVSVPKIATGSYVGTGTYGESNPTSLTFEFEPKFVIIEGDYGGATYGGYFINDSEFGMCNSIGRNFSVFLTWNNDSVSWVCNPDTKSSEYQLNISGATYFYLAIG